MNCLGSDYFAIGRSLRTLFGTSGLRTRSWGNLDAPCQCMRNRSRLPQVVEMVCVVHSR